MDLRASKTFQLLHSQIHTTLLGASCTLPTLGIVWTLLTCISLHVTPYVTSSYPKDEMIKLHFNVATICNIGLASAGGVPKNKEGRVFISVKNSFSFYTTSHHSSSNKFKLQQPSTYFLATTIAQELILWKPIFKRELVLIILQRTRVKPFSNTTWCMIWFYNSLLQR